MTSDVKQLKRHLDVVAFNVKGASTLVDSLLAGRIRTLEFKGDHWVVNGRKISIKSIIFQLDRFDDRAALQMRRQTIKLATGEITYKEWVEFMESMITGSHLALAMLASFATVAVVSKSPSIMSAISSDLRYFENFKKDIDKKLKALNKALKNNANPSDLIKQVIALVKAKQLGRADDSLAVSLAKTFRKAVWRSKMYLKSIRNTFWQVSQEAHKLLGYTEAMRILTAKESCKKVGDELGCVDVAGRWIKIDKMPPIGTLVCKNFCKCYLIFRKTSTT